MPPGANGWQSVAGLAGPAICGDYILFTPVVPASVQPYSSYPSAATPAPSLVNITPCASDELAASVGQTISATNATYVELTFTNTGTTSCALNDRWPLLTVDDSSGALIVTPRWTAWEPAFILTLGGSENPASSQVLAPAETAVTFLVVPPSTGAATCTTPGLMTADFSITGISLTTSLASTGVTLCHPAGLTTVYVTPLTVATSPGAVVPGAGAVPLADGTGYYYGTDSGSDPCSGSELSYNGITGACGFYGGQVGAFWSVLSGCSGVEGWGWNPDASASADSTFPDAPGTAPVYLLAGPGMAAGYDYRSGTPTSAQITAAENWGTKQAENVVAELSNPTIAEAIDQPVLFMDIEVDEGGEGEFDNSAIPYCGISDTTQVNGDVSPELNRDTFNAFWDYAYDNSGYQMGVYSSGSGGGQTGDWPVWFSGYSSLGSALEWTFLNETPTEASASNSPTSFSWSVASPEFFGGVTASGSQALAWQWATPEYSTKQQVDDLDQIDECRFPVYSPGC